MSIDYSEKCLKQGSYDFEPPVVDDKDNDDCLFVIALKQFNKNIKLPSEIPSYGRPKKSHQVSVSFGDIYKISNFGKVSFKWWMKAHFVKNVSGDNSSEDKEYIADDIDFLHSKKIPTVIFVPISNKAIEAVNNVEAFSSYPPKDIFNIKKTVPDIKKYFPLVHIFYGENWLSQAVFPSPNIFSSMFYYWMDKMMFLGYIRPLVNNDLWSVDPKHTADSLYEKFSQKFNYDIVTAEKTKMSLSEVDAIKKEPTKKLLKKKKKPTNQNEIKMSVITSALFNMFRGKFIWAAFLKLFHDILAFISPFLLGLIISAVETPDTNVIRFAFLYCVLLLLAKMGQTLLINKYFDIVNRHGIYFRSTLTTAIFRKMTRLKLTSANSIPTGDQVNLLSSDCHKVQDSLTYINLIWSAPFQIITSLAYLAAIVGYATITGIGILILVMPANYFIIKKVRRIQMELLKLRDMRLKKLTEVLSAIKMTRLYAWEEAFIKLISDIREQEIKKLRKLQYLQGVFILFWQGAPFLVSLGVFITYIFAGNVLTASTAFVAINIFNILAFPLFSLPNTINSVIQMTVCLRRILNFVSLDEIDPNILSYNDEENTENAIEIKANTHFYYTEDLDKPFDSFDDDSVKSETKQQQSTYRLSIDNDLKIKKGSLTFVIGRVGAGKSSLLSAILGELNGKRFLSDDKTNFTTKKLVKRNRNIAYVPQSAWIQNMTLQDNILFGKDFDEERYHQVVDLCSLMPDLELLPKGDLTEIGEKGVNLSGGQKQRINLARAVYSDCKLVLFDDPLSAVDSHVANDLFKNIISSQTGLLKDATRMLVTHKVELLKYADHILYVDDGKIIFSGTYSQFLQEENNFISELNLLKAEKIDSVDEPLIDEEAVKKLQPKKSIEQSKLKKLFDTERASEKTNTFPLYMDYIRSLGWATFSVTIVFMLITNLCSMGSNLWLANFTSASQNATESAITNHIKVLYVDEKMFLLGYGVFMVVQVIFTFLGAITMAHAAYLSGKRYHSSVLNRVLRAPMYFFDTTPAGRVINLLSRDVVVLDENLPMAFGTFLRILFNIVLVMLGIIIIIPYFIIPLVVLALLYYFAQIVYVNSSRQLQRLEAVARSPVFSYYLESTQGINIIRSYNKTDEFLHDFNNKLDKSVSIYTLIILSNRWISIRLETAGNFLVFFSALICVFQALYGSIASGYVGFIISNTTSVIATLNWMIRTRGEMENFIVSVERFNQYSTVDQERPWHENNDENINFEDSFEEIVKFQDYSTRYRPGLDPSLKNINLDIKNGEKIGVVGRTGAGKSSLILSLFRIIEPIAGQINLYGYNITKMGLYKLRNSLTVIPQESFLFQGTLRSNLDPLNIYSDDQIWKSLELSHLKDFVLKYNENDNTGLDMTINENGDNLSAGQKQLACLARALLKKSKILVLDEATASVDTSTDQLIQQTIRSEFSDCTVITVAHRLNTIMDYDRILVLDSGTIQEFDTPKKLLENHNSQFYKFCKDANLV